jgi:hypothetical protein
MNAVTHETGAYASDFFPQKETIVFPEADVEKYGSEDNAEYIYTLMAALEQFIKWLEHLKANGIYDNTRIIVISDHGGGYHNADIDFSEMESHNPLLLVKNTGAQGTITVSPALMTHSDTPALAAESLVVTGLVEVAENLNRVGEEAKKRPLWAVNEVSHQPLRHGPYEFKLSGKRELTGGDLFTREDWGEWE